MPARIHNTLFIPLGTLACGIMAGVVMNHVARDCFEACSAGHVPANRAPRVAVSIAMIG